MDFKNKNVLVAGGTGMIGIPLVEQLLENGASVRVSSLDSPTRCHEKAEFVSLDLSVMENCLAVCKDMDFVFYLLGSKASPKITNEKPADHFITNAMPQISMLEAARKTSPEGLMFTSSIGVYGPSEVMHEDDVWKTMPSGNDWYGGWAKRMGELQVESYRKQYGYKNWTIVRPANVYGPWDNFDPHHSMVVPSLIRRAAEATDSLTVWGDGSPRRDFIHARDVASCMMVVAKKGPAEPVNIGSGKARSIKDLAEIVTKNVNPSLKLEWDTDKPAGDQLRTLDTKRAVDLGFVPAISLEDGVAETVEWYRKQMEGKDGLFNPYFKK